VRRFLGGTVSQWPATKARRVLAALLRIGWSIKRQTSSHRILERAGWADYVFAFHDDEEIGPRMLAKIAKRTGLQPADLQDAVECEAPR
jgi:predicted RNA binding protein YcfA (HicA-like mRNA interferase family)